AGLDLPTVLTKTAAPAKQSAKAPVKWEARKAQTPVVSPSKDALRLQTLKAGDEAVIRWDDGTLYTGIGAGGGNMEVAAKFEPSDLKDYKHAAIKSVEISVWDLPTNVVLNIRQGGTIVYSQPVSGLTAESFKTIELTEPFSIDVTKDLWVGYSFAYANGEFPAGADEGPAVAGKGDLVSLDGAAFEALSAISNLDYNWNIAVTLVGGDIIGYNVYRDGALIAENVESLEYRDTVPAQGATVCYEVTAVYNEDLFFESDSSNKACLYSKGHLTIGVNDVTREEATNNPAFTAYIKEGTVLATDKADSILTLVKFSTVANSMSSAGTYDIKPLLTDLAASSYADNYVFIPASGVLTVTTFPTAITQQPEGKTICEGGQHTFSVAATGLDVKYQLQQEVNGVWTNVGTPVITSGTRTDASWTLPQITAAHAGNYRVWVDARSDKKYTDVVLLRVGLRDPNLIAYPWSDVPTVNNNPATNGGYTFVEFQWLRDGAPVNGATKPYIQVPKGTTANYTVELTTSDNKPLGICSFTPQSTTASLAVYPNPVTQGASLTLQSASLPEGSVANIYSSTGTLVKGNLPLSGVQNTIDITGLAHGFYVLQVSQPDGSKQTVNIVVN
ncbi:MAG: T9SS type A sorting domain-containing protein, partial [Prevotellaceae bacterium]|nr:T9SS type A sorting domain-containing protein [Prevotellaceae bacterium]